jgi:hypothetical protein
MWFCDMRQMPRLRDCFYEFTSQTLEWFRGLFARRAGRR